MGVGALRKLGLSAVSAVVVLSWSFAAQGDDHAKAEAFFKNNMKRSAENRVSSRIEQSIENRFRNLEVEITDLDGDDTRYSIFTVQPLYDNVAAGRSSFFQGSIIALDDNETLNLGLGQRWMLNDNKIIAGLTFSMTMNGMWATNV
jgi:hypothetical protein